MALAVAVLLLAACDGTAPRVQGPSAALGRETAHGWRCVDNDPPAGHAGPVSPYAGSCIPDSSTPQVVPAGSHDYATGMPPRVVIPTGQ